MNARFRQPTQALVAGFLAILAAACNGTNAAEMKRLELTGSSTVAPVIREIGRMYEAKHPGVRVDVQTGGSSRGLADARRGVIDFGMMSRDLEPGEDDVHGHPIARDAICMIVHESNPVAAISTEDIQKIYRGEVTRWQDVGGPPGTVAVIHKAAGRSTHEVFIEHFCLAPESIRPAVVIGDNEHGIKSVAGDPMALGYVSYGAAKIAIDRGAKIRTLPLDGLTPSVNNVRDGTFPLCRTLLLVSKDPPTGAAADFLRFIHSEEARKIIQSMALVATLED